MGLSKILLRKSSKNPFLKEFDLSSIEGDNFYEIKRFNKLTEAVRTSGTPLDSILVSNKRFNKNSFFKVINKILASRGTSSQDRFTKKILSQLEDYFYDTDTINIDDFFELVPILSVDIKSTRFKENEFYTLLDYYEYNEIISYIQSHYIELRLTLFIGRTTKLLRKSITCIIKRCTLDFNQSPQKIHSYEYIDLNNSHPYGKLFSIINYQFSIINNLIFYKDEEKVIGVVGLAYCS